MNTIAMPPVRKTIIAEYHKLHQLKKPGVILLILFCILYPGVDGGYAADGQAHVKSTGGPSFSDRTTQFLDHLTKASQDDCARIFGKYNTVISSTIDLKKVFFVPYKEVAKLLDHAVEESIDSLTLFTQPLLQDRNGSAIIFSEELLTRVNENFDFHGLFNISAIGETNGSPVRMTFLVVGQGRFIVGYNRNEKIKHPDYAFATGNYDYNELFLMDARKDSGGNPGLFNIKALADPNSEPHWMKGPLNVDIQSMTMTSDATGRNQILIKYALFGTKHKLIDPIPIEKLTKE
jgi:hypothetical protein